MDKTTPIDEEHEHSIFGASGASRWRNCKGSVQAIQHAREVKRIPLAEDVEDPEWTKEGSEAHDMAYRIRIGKAKLSDLSKEQEPLLEYINFLNELADSDGVLDVMDEETVPLWYRPEDKGTLDFGVATKKRIHFVDLKWGQGIYVEHEDNSQLAIYVRSWIAEAERITGQELHGETEVFLTVYQPRHYASDGPRTWETTVEELKDFCIDVEEDYKESNQLVEQDLSLEEIEDRLCAGDWCGFCPLKVVCNVRGVTSFGGLPPKINPLEDFELLAPEGEEEAPVDFKERLGQIVLTEQQVAWIVDNGPALTKFIKDVTEGEYDRLLAGGESKAHKMIEGNPKHARWKDEEAAEKLLKAKLGTSEARKKPEVITAPQARQKVKAWERENGKLSTRFHNRMEELIHRPPGSPKMVPINAPGEPLKLNVADEFEDEPGDLPEDISSML